MFEFIKTKKFFGMVCKYDWRLNDLNSNTLKLATEEIANFQLLKINIRLNVHVQWTQTKTHRYSKLCSLFVYVCDRLIANNKFNWSQIKRRQSNPFLAIV